MAAVWRAAEQVVPDPRDQPTQLNSRYVSVAMEEREHDAQPHRVRRGERQQEAQRRRQQREADERDCDVDGGAHN